MEPQVVVGLLSAGITAVIVAVLNAIFNRRKLSAEATEIITKAAAGTVEQVVKDNESLRTRLAKVEAELEAMRATQSLVDQRERAHQEIEERYRWHLERWHRYAGRLIEEIRTLGGVVEDPPPLFPEPESLRPTSFRL